MAKKNFGNLGERLAPVAASQPSLRPPAALSVVSPTSEAVRTPTAPMGKEGAAVQQAFALRPALRKQLRAMAAAADQTVSGFILAALRDKGLPVTESDIMDGRKQRHR